MAEEGDILLSDLTTAENITAAALLYLAQVDANSESGFISRSVTTEALAAFIASSLQYAGLNTTAKTIIAAINEVATGGGGGASVIYGTTAPTAAQGSNGSIYVQYETTGGADSIVAVFCKINGNWLNFPTGASLPDAEGVGF